MVSYRPIPEIVAVLRSHEAKAAKVGKELSQILKRLGVAE
jgi:hypothetical protein